jgi:hypothetical protein
MRNPALVLLLSCVIAVATLPAQQAGMSQRQIDAVKKALQRIAVSNNMVESVIYDGMTYKEVLAVLDVPSLSIDLRTSNDRSRGSLDYLSVVGRYCIYWSSSVPYDNPVVVGYSLADDRNILHNRLP